MRMPAGERALRRALDHGTVGERVLEREAELDDVCARLQPPRPASSGVSGSETR